MDSAQQTTAPIEQFCDAESIDLAGAYRVQHALVACRVARGERVIGTKLGFTSVAKMAQMGVSEIIVGQLTERMLIADGGRAELSRFIHPRVEPEVAFRLGRDVDPTGGTDDIELAVDAVAPALEIIDSRYVDFRFSLPDVVADNTSASAFVVGRWQALPDDVGDLAVELRVDGVVARSGTTAAILGHPMQALRALVELAARYGFPLPAGQTILAGAATEAVPLTAAVVEASVAGLGVVGVQGIDA